MNEFGAAVRIAGIIERVHADEDLVRFEYLRPGQCERKKYRVTRGHVGNGNLQVHCGLVPAFRNGDFIGEGGVAEYTKIDPGDAMIVRVKCARDAARGLQFDPVPLAIIEREGVTVEALATGKCETGGGIESPAKQADGFGHELLERRGVDPIIVVPLERLRVRSRSLWLILAGLTIGVVFIFVNHQAYDGFFQSDELDNLKWAPLLPSRDFIEGLLSPKFQVDNFRPVGHFYFAAMGRAFGLNFPPYMTAIFTIHLINALLLYLLARKLSIPAWHTLAAVAFFVFSAAAVDAYWKPMYVFDLLCATFSLASILFYARRRWVLSFIAFWLAYKSKELAVMLPAVLVVYEYWFGERRFQFTIPFLLASLSFGIQGIVWNPNKNNAYTFRFTLDALRHTVPFYSGRFLILPFSGLALAFVRDRRVWFGLISMCILMVPLLFLPGRLYQAYGYLPLTCAAIAFGAAASHLNAVWAWIAVAVWMPFNVHELRMERRVKLALDDQTFAYVDTMAKWAAQNPRIETFVFDGAPPGLESWGITGAWNIIHHRQDLPVVWVHSDEASAARLPDAVAYGSWDGQRQVLTISIRRRSQ